MPFIGEPSLEAAVALFCAATVAIVAAGTRLTGVADVLAERTGLGEAVVGAVLLGGSTSLSGIVTSVTAASNGSAELAVSNAVGGIAVQTVFLAVADLAYRGVNLEHAAASPANLAQGALLVTLLAVPLLAFSGPEVSLLGVHPATPLLLASYAFGLRVVSDVQADPMWGAKRTPETQDEEEESSEDSGFSGQSLRSLWAQFVLLGLTIGVAGWVVGRTGITISEQTGLTATVVGALLTATVTSLPELVTSVAAVRRGALALAVGGIIGGNAFDTIFIAFSDVFYRAGSIYHSISQQQVFLISLTMMLTGVLLLGLLRREQQGFANIGFESALVLLLYVGGLAFLGFG